MSQSILNDLLSQLQGGASGQIAQQLGADTQTTQQAIGAALPMIVGALGRNANRKAVPTLCSMLCNATTAVAMPPT